MDGRQFWPAELTARTEPIGKSIYYFTNRKDMRRVGNLATLQLSTPTQVKTLQLATCHTWTKDCWGFRRSAACGRFGRSQAGSIQEQPSQVGKPSHYARLQGNLLF